MLVYTAKICFSAWAITWPIVTTGHDRMEDIGSLPGGYAPASSSPPPSGGTGGRSSAGRGSGRGPTKGRSNRGRTVLTEKQRTILTACFQHNPKPDALLKVITLDFFKAAEYDIFILNKILKGNNNRNNFKTKLAPILLGAASRNDRPKCQSH